MRLREAIREWKLKRILSRQQRHEAKKQRAETLFSYIYPDDACWDKMKEAVNLGDLAFIQKHTLTCHHHRSGLLLPVAARKGRLDVVKHLYTISDSEMDPQVMENTLKVAARMNHLPILVWAHVNNLGGWSYKLMDVAAAFGRLKVVKWLHKYRTEGCTTDAMDNAAGKGHLKVVKWLHRHRTEGCTVAAMDHAAADGKLTTVQWLHKHRTEGCTTDAMDEAARHGEVFVIKWLHEHRHEGCTTSAMDSAASNGYLQIVKWLHENRTEGCTTAAMDQAAANGHEDILEWLQQTRTEGCTTAAMDNAAKRGNWQVVLWLDKHRNEGCTAKAMDKAAKRGDLPMVKWLHEHQNAGCTTEAMDQAAACGELDMVEWLHNNRTEGCTTQAMDMAAKRGYFETVQFLHENRTEGCTFGALNVAIAHQDVKLVKFLYENRPELSQWPQFKHVETLRVLLGSNDYRDAGMLECIIDSRRNRHAHAETTRVDEENQLKDHNGSSQVTRFRLTLVKFVLNHKLAESSFGISHLVSLYIVQDYQQRINPIEAADRGYIYWLALYGALGSGHLGWLACRGNFDGARRMHDCMNKTSCEWKCDDQFKLLTMERGDLAYIQWHIRNCSMKFDEVIYLAIWTGRNDVIRWIQTHYLRGNQDNAVSGEARWHEEPMQTELDFAAAANDLFTVEYLHNVKYEDGRCSTKAMDLAAANGHFEMVRWLHNHRREGCTTDAMDMAATNGHLDVLKWLHHHRREGYTMLAADGAAANGHLQVIQWLYAVDETSRGKLAPAKVLTAGQFESQETRRFRDSLPSILGNIRSQRHSPLDLAAYHGHFEVVKFLHEHQGGRLIATQAMDLAALSGHLRIVRYLHNNRSEGCSATAVYGALRHKYYKVALYLYQHRPECEQWPSDEDLPGFVETLLKSRIDPVIRQLLSFFYLHRNVQLSPRVMDQAALEGDINLVRVIHELGLGNCTTTALDFSAMKGDMEMIKFLHFNRSEGCTPNAMDGAAEAGRFDAVEFLHDHRTEGCTRNAIDLAARNGHEDIVKFLLLNRKDGHSPYATYWATVNNHVGVVRCMVDSKTLVDVDKCLQVARSHKNREMIEIFEELAVSRDVQRSSSSRSRARRIDTHCTKKIAAICPPQSIMLRAMRDFLSQSASDDLVSIRSS
ncbi:hypothetical protein Poli38472_004431 [Pythium oligandrum]|uniref:Uncharacterized protein n=1 Tax=Pythium oligandrum TaxID=41045 RepID=A0A8K1CA33_PYTOL|nr:hypothetical protein Poli38472_004431 [Pythium oligandrum]|eukprot:TMW59362.1 hypothetical protein Poli38472_004431 [Pythium oligandrum]